MLEKAQELINNKEVLTQEERDLVFQVSPEWVAEYLFYNSWNNTYLNLNVYSEVEKERYDLQREMGY
jgi:hypothetical protein